MPHGALSTAGSADEARRLGLRHYYTGVPCSHGHVTERYTVDNTCLGCIAARQRAYRARDRDAEGRLTRPQKRFVPTSAHVYAFRTERFVKVGVTSDLKHRLRKIRTGCPTPVEVEHVTDLLPWATAMATERKAHEYLSACHLHGDWFEADPEKTANAIQHALAA